MAFTLLALTASAAPPRPSSPAAGPHSPETVIRKTLGARFPEIQLLDVRPSLIPNVYEIYTLSGLAYTDPTGTYLIEGAMIDTASRRNLSQERLDAFSRIDFGTLPLQQAIKIVKGKGSRKLAVFSDPECPYCQDLEKTLASVQDTTVYVFLYPLANLHPDAPARARAIWCAEDRSAAWTQWMLEQKLPQNDGKCAGVPLEANVKLGERLHIPSTPTLYAGDGRRASGSQSAEAIEAFLNNNGGG